MDSNNPRVIYVEDNEAVRTSISRIIEFSGYEIMDYASASELYRAGTLAEADCLIVDLMLPGMNGSRLIKRIRDEGNNIPAILVSGEFSAQSYQSIRALPNTACLTKPFKLTDLLNLISKTLGRRQIADAA